MCKETNKFISFYDIDITDGFWHDRQNLNNNVTIKAVYDRFKETGRFEALKQNYQEGQPNRPHIFWDSDVAKWIEAAAYIYEKNHDEELLALCEEMIDDIGNTRDENGYFNSYFQQFEREAIFTRRTDHELYCAGHLMEAAVAYFECTGRDKFLKIMCDFADLIEKVFVNEKSAAFTTPGHEEIELALVRLYKATNEERYLKLSKFFIDERGTKEEDEYDFAKHNYAQSSMPLRELSLAEGHSVRACYLYAGMADIAYEYGDKELYDACVRLFDNITEKRMYVTGGIGSAHQGESFTIDYDLPNSTAYTESCAAIALCYFARRMLKMDIDSKYSDVIERIIYNGFLSSTSLDGKSFFYENPLDIDPKMKDRLTSVKGREHFPETERLEVFGCSCCPPNITRFVASIADYIYSENDDTLFVHQYISSETEKVKMYSGFPFDGKVTISAAGYKKIAIRIPSWAENCSIKVNGESAICEIKKGYAYIDATENTLIDLYFPMEISLVESNPEVFANSGKVVLTKGPVVYCLENTDNEVSVHKLYLKNELNAKVEFDKELKAEVIYTDAYKKEFTSLYRKLNSNYEKVTAKFIPYYAFANRGTQEMTVWVNFIG